MRIFYDTEFIEDGRTIELISIGMVREDGRELYLVREEIKTDAELYDRIRGHHWLMNNVVPHLPLDPRPHNKTRAPLAKNAGAFHLDMNDLRVMPRRLIRNQVRAFVQDTALPELWSWYGAYDHVALAQLFGPMVELPKGFPMWTNDLKQECRRRGDPKLPKQDGAEHNALADARWLRDAYDWLTAQEAP